MNSTFHQQRRARKGQIDSLRALAIFFVLFDHLWLKSGGGPVGSQGVQLFLIISGYLITGIILRAKSSLEASQRPAWAGLRPFYVRRVLRILPAFYLLIGLTWVLARQEFEHSLPLHLMFLTNFLFAWTNEWGPPWQLAHLWTLSVQEQFYLLWPILVLTVSARALVAWIIGLALAGVAFRVGIVLSSRLDSVAAFTLPLAVVPALCCGAWLAMSESRDRIPSWISDPGRIWPTAMLIAFAASYAIQLPGWLHYLVLDQLWLIGLAALLIGARNGIPGLFGRLLNFPLLQYFGRMALGIYLYHLLAASFVWKLCAKMGWSYGRGPEVFFVAGAMTLGLAIASWHLIEEPVNRLKRHFPYVKPR